MALTKVTDEVQAITAVVPTGGDFTVGGGASASAIRFMEPSGSGTHYTALKAQAQAGNITYTLPASDGTSGYVLSTNGSGTLSWVAGGSAFSSPQGRLTLVTATPVMVTEQAAKQTIYYTPYLGDKIPLYDGSSWSLSTFTELTLSMAGSANWAANSNYDLYVYNDGGTLRLGTGAAWTSDTARNESLTMLNGILTNAATMTLRYGASSTVSISANRATYVGTFRTTASTGTTTWEIGGTAAGGDAINLYLWNQYNREPTGAYCRDSTNNWTYSSTAWRSLNNSTANRISVVIGDAAAVVTARLQVMQYVPADTRYGAVAVEKDATTTQTVPGTQWPFYAGGVSEFQAGSIGYWRGHPGLGFHYFQAIESGHASGWIIYGDENMLLTIDGRF